MGTKRRRTAAQCAEDNLAQQMKEVMNEELSKETKQLKQQIEALRQENAQNSQASNILTQMIQRGQCAVDENGDVQVVTHSQPSSIHNVEDDN